MLARTAWVGVVGSVIAVALGATLLCCRGTSGAWSSSASLSSPACPRASEPQTIGRIESAEIDEASGIVASATNPGVFWVHNDSGDSARAFAVRGAGQVVATLLYDTGRVRDVEDVAIEDVGPGESFLYFGDIGDNAAKRAQVILHRVPEPKLADGPAQELTRTSEKMAVTYVDGPHDAETLLFDPVTKDLFIATKVIFGGATIHRVGPFQPGASVTTQKIATVPVNLATGGDISRDGRFIAIRGYGANAFVWTRDAGESIASALGRAPCKLPLAAESQGEALGFFPRGDGYVTISEGKSPELHVVRFP